MRRDPDYDELRRLARARLLTPAIVALYRDIVAAKVSAGQPVSEEDDLFLRSLGIDPSRWAPVH